MIYSFKYSRNTIPVLFYYYWVCARVKKERRDCVFKASLRLQGIDIDLRTHTDFLFLKSQGIDGLPDNLRFLYYTFFNPSFLRNMKPWEFALVCRKGSLGVGHFPYHSWHKLPKENIVKNVGLKIEYGREIEQPKDMGKYKSVGDKEHCKIIELYVNGLGYDKIGEQIGRSSRTPHTHVKKHNAAVERSGFCATCRRFGGEYAGTVAKKRIFDHSEVFLPLFTYPFPSPT